MKFEHHLIYFNLSAYCFKVLTRFSRARAFLYIFNNDSSIIKYSIKTSGCNHYIIRSLTEFITNVKIEASVAFPSIINILSDELNFSIMATWLPLKCFAKRNVPFSVFSIDANFVRSSIVSMIILKFVIRRQVFLRFCDAFSAPADRRSCNPSVTGIKSSRQLIFRVNGIVSSLSLLSLHDIDPFMLTVEISLST